MNLEKQKNFLIRFSFWAVIAAGCYLLFKFVLAYLFPFLAAFVIAAILNSPIRRLSALYRRHSVTAASLIVAVFYLV